MICIYSNKTAAHGQVPVLFLLPLYSWSFAWILLFNSEEILSNIHNFSSFWNEAQHHRNQREQFLLWWGRLHLAFSKYPGKVWERLQKLFNCSSLSCCLTPELAAAGVTAQPPLAGCSLQESHAPCFRLSWAFFFTVAVPCEDQNSPLIFAQHFPIDPRRINKAGAACWASRARGSIHPPGRQQRFQGSTEPPLLPTVLSLTGQESPPPSASLWGRNTPQKPDIQIMCWIRVALRTGWAEDNPWRPPTMFFYFYRVIKTHIFLSWMT